MIDIYYICRLILFSQFTNQALYSEGNESDKEGAKYGLQDIGERVGIDGAIVAGGDDAAADDGEAWTEVEEKYSTYFSWQAVRQRLP